MVKGRILSALGAGVLVCAVSMPVLAGSVLRLPASRGVPISSQPAAVTYGVMPSQPQGSYVVDADLDGFLLCNEFGPTNATVPTDQFESVFLRARHGAWLFGNIDNGVTGSVTGIKGVTYMSGALNIDTCSANGDAACAGAALQCYVADDHGLGVADTRQMFYDGFDALTAGPNNSSVSVTVTHWPTSSDDTFRFDILVSIPTSGGGQLQGQTASDPGTQYLLKQGYDFSVFSGCNFLPNGRLVNATETISGACTMRNPANRPPTDVPVVAAALFTNAATHDSDYSDNVGFGYPCVPSPGAPGQCTYPN